MYSIYYFPRLAYRSIWIEISSYNAFEGEPYLIVNINWDNKRIIGMQNGYHASNNFSGTIYYHIQQRYLILPGLSGISNCCELIY